MNRKESAYHVRAYHLGDEEEIVRLFNLTYEDHAGFVPRTANYWLWCCRMRPGVDDNGIFVVEKDRSNQIVGYAVLGKSGDIWEFCVSPQSNKKRIVAILLESATSYLAEAGAEKIVLNVSAEDSAMTQAIEQKGFIDFPVERMYLGVLDFEALVELIAQNCAGEMEHLQEVFSFRLKNARPWINPQFAISVKKGAISIVPYTESDSIVMEIDAVALTSILMGSNKPFELLLQRRLRVRPLLKTNRALQFLSLIKTHSPWFHARADIG